MTWTILGAVYTCTGTIEFVGDGRNVTSVTGNHAAGNNNTQVQALAIASQELVGGVPTNIDRFFTNLTILSLSNTGLTHVSRADFDQYRDLQILILFNNRLETLDGDVFWSTPNLQYINLSSNQIRHLGENVFKNVSFLRTLRLLGNVCINRYIDNNPTEIAAFLWQTSFNCPPSVAQIEREILNGQEFQGIISSLSSRISLLENQVVALESQINVRENEQ